MKLPILMIWTLVVYASAEGDEEDPPAVYAPQPSGEYHFFEGFEGADAFAAGRMVKSTDPKYAGQPVNIIADDNGIEGDYVAALEGKAKHYGMVLPFETAFSGNGDFVLQYEVRLTEGLECGGAYVKVLAHDTMPAAEEVNNDTPYIIMFGPDKCGETDKVHFIMRHQNPISKEWEEKHLKSPPTVQSDKHSHLYTLVIRKDNTFQIRIDNEMKKEGSLLEEMEPPINPPKQTDDPDDTKPEDWVDEAQITDPDASKPDDWDEDAPREIEDADADKPEGWLDDEPEYVADPDSEKPDDWDDDEDGMYEPPQIENPKCVEAPGCGSWVRPMKSNPDYKGKWSAPMIDNPAYKGEWAPQQIDNPNFFVDEQPSNLPQVAGVAIEVWTMSKGITFDNILLGSDPMVADSFAEDTFEKKIEVQAHSAKDKAKKERAAKRQTLLEDGTLSSKAQYYFETWIMDTAGENPILAALVLIGSTFGLLFFIRSMCGGQNQYDDPVSPPKRPTAETKREDADEDNEEDTEEDEDKEEDGEKEGGDSDGEITKKPNLRQRKKKKTRKAE